MACAHCGSENTKKHGRDQDGNQRHRCRDCGKTYSDKPAAPLGRMTTDPEQAAFALRLLLEGMSIRAARRMTGLGRNTLARAILTAGENCRRLLAATVRSVPAAEVECDELWSPVFCKERVRALRGYGEEVGDCYTFVGIDRATKLVLTYHVGRRTFVDADRFCRKLRMAVGGRPSTRTGSSRTARPSVITSGGTSTTAFSSRSTGPRRTATGRSGGTARPR